MGCLEVFASDTASWCSTATAFMKHELYVLKIYQLGDRDGKTHCDFTALNQKMTGGWLYIQISGKRILLYMKGA